MMKLVVALSMVALCGGLMSGLPAEAKEEGQRHGSQDDQSV